MDKIWAEKWANQNIHEQLALIELLFLFRYQESSLEIFEKSLDMLKVFRLMTNF